MQAVIPPSAVAAVGGRVQGGGLIADPGPGVTQQKVDAIRAALLAGGADGYATAELGPQPGRDLPSAWLILWIAVALIIGVVLVVTALAVVDSDDDSATFAAVGATARLRRTLSGWSAATTTLVGCVLGAAVGLLTAWAVLTMSNGAGTVEPITLPWAQVAILVLGLPVVAWLLAALFTRSKTQLIRREV